MLDGPIRLRPRGECKAITGVAANEDAVEEDAVSEKLPKASEKLPKASEKLPNASETAAGFGSRFGIFGSRFSWNPFDDFDLGADDPMKKSATRRADEAITRAIGALIADDTESAREHIQDARDALRSAARDVAAARSQVCARLVFHPHPTPNKETVAGAWCVGWSEEMVVAARRKWQRAFLEQEWPLPPQSRCRLNLGRRNRPFLFVYGVPLVYLYLTRAGPRGHRAVHSAGSAAGGCAFRGEARVGLARFWEEGQHVGDGCTRHTAPCVCRC